MKKLTTFEYFGSGNREVKLKNLAIIDIQANEDLEAPWHYHENLYFFYQNKGKMTETNKRKTINSKPGTLILHNNNDPHYNKAFSSDSNYFHFELEKQWFERLDLKLNEIEGSFDLTSPSLKLIFKKLIKESTAFDKVTQVSVDGLLLQAFSEIIRYNPIVTDKKPQWVSKIIEIIHDGEWERLCVNNLANELGIHPVYLSRKFPQYFQSTLGDYIRNVKLDQASVLLLDKHSSNAQIAAECGFTDESHFIKLFRTKFGMTPANYTKLATKG